ncbi:GPI ethanolamine phosphate transferase 2 [Diplonema papillatum]|nr:GPI ethanolamine phosphate transferase 2 [Diplonema papillatum]
MLCRGFAVLLLSLSGGCLLFVGLVGGGHQLAVQVKDSGNEPRRDDSALCGQCESVIGKCERVVLMLVDGLRYKATTRRLEAGGVHTFRYLNSLLANGSAVRALSVAKPPTVTLPRLKSMMTGRVSAFSDVLFNFFGDSASDDDFLRSAKRAGKKLVVHGDDTWLRMWPRGTFDDRSDPVLSFFVSDFTEVDDNVTRHVDNELSQPCDWHVLILHYLGIDHIGHYLGADAPEMLRKEAEMDAIIERIHAKLPSDAILVVASDHGMTSRGNHGGSSTDEVDSVVAALFPRGSSPALSDPGASDPLFPSAPGRNAATMQQVDLASTLALVLGLPIPTTNAGLFWRPLFAPASRKACLQCNAAQLAGDVDASFSELAAIAESRTAGEEIHVPLSLAGAFLVFCILLVLPDDGRSIWAPCAGSALLSLAVFSSTFAEESHVLHFYLASTAFLREFLRGLRAPAPLGFRALRALLPAVTLRALWGWTQTGILALSNPSEHLMASDWVEQYGLSPIVHFVLAAVVVGSVHSGMDPKGGGRWWCTAVLFAFGVARYLDVGHFWGVMLRWLGIAAAAFRVFAVSRGMLRLSRSEEDASAPEYALPSGSSAARRSLDGLGKAEPQNARRAMKELAASLAAIFSCVVPAVDAPPVLLAVLLFCQLADAGTIDGGRKHRGASSPLAAFLFLLSALCAHAGTGRSISIGHLRFSSAYDVVLSYHPLVLAVLVLAIQYSGLLSVLLPLCHGNNPAYSIAVSYFAFHVLSAALAVVFFRNHLFIWSVFAPRLLFCVVDLVAFALFSLLVFALPGARRA